MKSKDSLRLESLRAIKSAIILMETKSGAKSNPSQEDEIALLQKLVKQRKDSAAIFKDQNRDGLASIELAQADIIAQFLPEQLSSDAIEKIIDEIINETGAKGIRDMGQVMSKAIKEISGKADGKTISIIVKQKLNR
jgi:uncharacterized protein YqeY